MGDLDITLRTFIAELSIVANKGLRTDDEEIDDRFWASIVNSGRATVAKRDVDKDRLPGSALEQTLSCLDVIVVPSYECCGEPSECHVLRTKDKIPKFLEGAEGPIITYIGGVGGFNFFQKLTSHRVRWSFHDEFTGHLRKVIYLNDYLYIVNDPDLKQIEVRGVFDNPLGIDKCADFDSPYPIYGWMKEPIKKEILYHLELLERPTKDKVNNADGTKTV